MKNLDIQLNSAIRSALKIGGGFLMSYGVHASSFWELLTGGAIAALGVLWSALYHAGIPTLPPPKDK